MIERIIYTLHPDLELAIEYLETTISKSRTASSMLKKIIKTLDNSNEPEEEIAEEDITEYIEYDKIELGELLASGKINKATYEKELNETLDRGKTRRLLMDINYDEPIAAAELLCALSGKPTTSFDMAMEYIDSKHGQKFLKLTADAPELESIQEPLKLAHTLSERLTDEMVMELLGIHGERERMDWGSSAIELKDAIALRLIDK